MNLNVRSTRTTLTLAALILCSGSALAADDGHPHHVAVALGTGWQGSGNSTFAGLDYAYNFEGGNYIGLFYEAARGDFDIDAFGVLFGRHFGDGWKASIGPAIETKLKKDKDLLLVRVQGAYEWHSGSWSYGPVASYDLIEDLTDAFYIGFTLGYGF